MCSGDAVNSRLAAPSATIRLDASVRQPLSVRTGGHGHRKEESKHTLVSVRLCIHDPCLKLRVEKCERVEADERMNEQTT